MLTDNTMITHFDKKDYRAIHDVLYDLTLYNFCRG